MPQFPVGTLWTEPSPYRSAAFLSLSEKLQSLRSLVHSRAYSILGSISSKFLCLVTGLRFFSPGLVALIYLLGLLPRAGQEPVCTSRVCAEPQASPRPCCAKVGVGVGVDGGLRGGPGEKEVVLMREPGFPGEAHPRQRCWRHHPLPWSSCMPGTAHTPYTRHCISSMSNTAAVPLELGFTPDLSDFTMEEACPRQKERRSQKFWTHWMADLTGRQEYSFFE